MKSLDERIITCRRCPRLIKHIQNVAQKKTKRFIDWDYWGKPVQNFGETEADLLIIGLAPAAHGANRTGRMFTGDRSGDWLYRALHKSGFANQPQSIETNDGLKLNRCLITAVCHCAPPENKPTPKELENCVDWLDETVRAFTGKVYLALGQIAWKETLKRLRKLNIIDKSALPFSHSCYFELPENRHLFGSYHPSQQNTFTGRLTEEMFDDVFNKIRDVIDLKPIST